MNKGHTLTVFVVLFGIVLLFAGSACAAVDFPADEAGICAYVNVSTRAGATTWVVDGGNAGYANAVEEVGI